MKIDFEMLGIEMARFALLLFGTMLLTAILGMPLRAQYYPPGYRPPPPAYAPPPCQAVTSGPFRGAARGAAGGALFGAIGGNAGKGAAIGAAVGGVAGAARRGSARASGACY
jgi:Glycine-zipper domain